MKKLISIYLENLVLTSIVIVYVGILFSILANMWMQEIYNNNPVTVGILGVYSAVFVSGASIGITTMVKMVIGSKS